MQQVKSILHQVIASLAVAEDALQFEHRDLHWGNVLVKPTTCTQFNYTLQGKPFSIESHGVKVAIIDFTLSRLHKGLYSYGFMSTHIQVCRSQYFKIMSNTFTVLYTVLEAGTTLNIISISNIYTSYL